MMTAPSLLLVQVHYSAASLEARQGLRRQNQSEVDLKLSAPTQPPSLFRLNAPWKNNHNDPGEKVRLRRGKQVSPGVTTGTN